jgi:hypothetical protein
LQEIRFNKWSFLNFAGIAKRKSNREKLSGSKAKKEMLMARVELE